LKNNLLIQRLGKFYLFYLGILPILATFAIVLANGLRWPMLIFMGGTGAVGVYLAATYSYTRLPDKVFPLLVMLLDGPLFVTLLLRDGLNPLAFAIEGYLIDGSAIWVSILILAFISPLPTRGQRFWSIVFMIIAVGVNIVLFWPYLQLFVGEDWGHLIWLVVGFTEAVIASFVLVSKDDVVRSGDGSILYIGLLVMLWVVALFLGNILYEVGFLGL